MARRSAKDSREAHCTEERSRVRLGSSLVSQAKSFSDTTHPEYVLRRQRLLFLYKISAPILVFYCIQAIVLRLAFTLFLDAITITLFVSSLRTYTSSGNLVKASWQYLLGFSVLVGFTPLVDNQVKSSVIWMLPLIPLIAAHLLGARAALVFAGGTATVMMGTWLSTFWWTIAPEHHFKLFDKILLHEFSLVIAAGLALSALRTTKAQILMMRTQQEQLRKAQVSTQKAREAKSQFLANMSHEIRTPLNGILGITEILAQGCEDDEAQATLKIAQDCGNRLLHLLNGLLDLSKLEAGKLKLRAEEFALSSLRRELELKFKNSCSENCIDLKIEGNEHERRVSGDRKRLVQILSILIDNAIKHSQGREVRVLIQFSPEPQELHCEVLDDGIGLTEPPRINSEAFSSHAPLRSHDSREGAGIGLVLASKLVELMDGELRFETAPHQGMKVDLSLPLQTLAAITPHQRISKVESPTEGSSDSMRVLLVDDNAINRVVARQVLRHFDCITQEATNGLEALELAQRESFDLILMDLHMPQMSGLDATRALRSEIGPNQRTPIVALTAGEYDDGLKERQEAGMNDFLNKPIERVELERILAKYRPQAEHAQAQTA